MESDLNRDCGCGSVCLAYPHGRCPRDPMDKILKDQLRRRCRWLLTDEELRKVIDDE